MAPHPMKPINKILAGIMDAIEVSRGNFPVGTRMTFTLDRSQDISGITLPPGKYEISRLEDEQIIKSTTRTCTYCNGSGKNIRTMWETDCPICSRS